MRNFFPNGNSFKVRVIMHQRYHHRQPGNFILSPPWFSQPLSPKIPFSQFAHEQARGREMRWQKNREKRGTGAVVSI